MKRNIAVTIVAASIAASCISRTEHGPCIGVVDKGEPGVRYGISAWNITMGIVFFPFIYPPIKVLADQTLCPEGR